jgi:hypothetical protein
MKKKHQAVADELRGLMLDNVPIYFEEKNGQHAFMIDLAEWARRRGLRVPRRSSIYRRMEAAALRLADRE